MQDWISADQIAGLFTELLLPYEYRPILCSLSQYSKVANITTTVLKFIDSTSNYGSTNAMQCTYMYMLTSPLHRCPKKILSFFTFNPFHYLKAE